ncbi:MAG: zinc-binding dehydrogenase, partial [Acidimicrobiia bacterium]
GQRVNTNRPRRPPASSAAWAVDASATGISAATRNVTAHPVWVRDYVRATDSLDELRRLVEDGRVTLRVAAEIPVADASTAHAALEAGGRRGRFVLTR